MAAFNHGSQNPSKFNNWLLQAYMSQLQHPTFSILVVLALLWKDNISYKAAWTLPRTGTVSILLVIESSVGLGGQQLETGSGHVCWLTARGLSLNHRSN